MNVSQLQQARDLTLPSRDAMLHRAPSVQQFWNSNQALLVQAWEQWEESEKGELPILNSRLLDSTLREAVMQAWKTPSTEGTVRDLLEEVTPGVFQFQFFDPDRLFELRNYMEKVWDAQIALRPPYGIVLNRRGAMLDSRSEGYLAAPSFQAFYQELLNVYMRPISRMLFPEIMGYDSQTFGFSIHYQPNTDTSIRPHTDASSVTLNVNLNLPTETFTGSTVDFYDPFTGSTKALSFKPGMAMLHRGNVPHAAQPITSGERTNFVLWLYGERGQVPPQTSAPSQLEATKRWTLSSATQDGFAPF